jgi:DNA uptake protein ComE-like DNA-binding protein
VISKPQQGAVLIVLLILFVVQWLRLGKLEVDTTLDLSQIDFYQNQLDSLREQATDNNRKIFLYNPNFISDYQAYTLGLTTREYDRLSSFRSQGKYIYSVSEFQKITKVSDSLMNELMPQFRFPIPSKRENKDLLPIRFKKKDINTAQKTDLLVINGIGSKLSERIVKYRSYLSGFSLMDQCYEVYGLDSLVVERLKKRFEIQTQPLIKKKDINRLDLIELQRIPYVSEEDARKIIALRTKNKVLEWDVLSELFVNSPNKMERIKLYLY